MASRPVQNGATMAKGKMQKNQVDQSYNFFIFLGKINSSTHPSFRATGKTVGSAFCVIWILENAHDMGNYFIQIDWLTD